MNLKSENTKLKTFQKLQFFLAAGFLLTSFVKFKPVLEIFFPLHTKILLSRIFAFPLIIITFGLLTLKPKDKKIHIPSVYKYCLLFLTALIVTLPFSLAQTVSFRYFLSILFGAMVSFSLYQTFRSRPLADFFKILMFTLLLTSLVALINLSLSQWGIDPPLGELRTDAAIGLFKRFHEGGIFALTFLLILLGVEFSGDQRLMPAPRWLLRSGIFLGSMFLLASGKVSNMVALVSALAFYLLFFRNLEALKKVSVFAVILLLQMLMFYWVYRPVFDRITYRIQSRLTERIPGTLEADFVVDNLGNTFRAFSENPISGTGMGAYQLFYGTPGIHGFYLRIIGEAGLIGITGFIIFLLLLLRSAVLKIRKSETSNTQWLKHFLPLFGGLLVSWLYNYELVNVVFWVLIATLALALENKEHLSHKPKGISQ